MIPDVSISHLLDQLIMLVNKPKQHALIIEVNDRKYVYCSYK